MENWKVNDVKQKKRNENDKMREKYEYDIIYCIGREERCMILLVRYSDHIHYIKNMCLVCCTIYLKRACFVYFFFIFLYYIIVRIKSVLTYNIFIYTRTHIHTHITTFSPPSNFSAWYHLYNSMLV